MKAILNELRRSGELTKGIAFKVVARNPLADETELLSKLGITRNECDSCDVLWAFENEIAFISFFSRLRTSQDTYVLYEFDDEAINGGHHFNVATMQFPLETKHIEKGIRWLSGWLTSRESEITKLKPSESFRVTDKDIC